MESATKLFNESLKLMISVNEKSFEPKFQVDEDVVLYIQDITHRIISNIIFVKDLKPTEGNCVPYRIILRSIISDIVEGCYTLSYVFPHRNEKDYNLHNDHIWRLNLNALCTKRKYIEEQIRFFQNLGKDIDVPDISKLYKDNPLYVNPQTTSFFKKDDYKPLAMANMFERLRVEDIFSIHYETIYSQYRLLSLTEHYAPITREYSHQFENDDIIYCHVAKAILFGCDPLSRIIDEWLTIGTFDKS